MPWADQSIFDAIYHEEGPHKATSWLYNQSKSHALIHRDGTSSGIHWVHSSDWGPILISINEAKPEKDPRDIAAAAHLQIPTEDSKHLCNEQDDVIEEHSSFDAELQTCTFCWTSRNEKNHLRVQVDLNGDPYSFHFSPYAYFPEHCIVATKEHRPMLIDKRTMNDILELCALFPDYFFGSNADLPIVGGSILNHHHYQGGRFAFPLDSALTLKSFSLPGFPQIKAELLKWPLTCIRLSGTEREELADAANALLLWWKGYSDPDTGILARTPDGIQHNTITPIAHKNNDFYTLDLVFRCNITSEEHPLGVFHPHEEVHCVKKENIGLIEAMGLAILPPRVKDSFEVSDASSESDRELVGRLFTKGLEQCGVLATEEAQEKALSSLVSFLETEARDAN